jgi:hypothetical protein
MDSTAPELVIQRYDASAVPEKQEDTLAAYSEETLTRPCWLKPVHAPLP